MSRKINIARYSKKIWIILLGLLFCFYMLDNLTLSSIIGYEVYSNIFKPVLWIGLAFFIWKLPNLHSAAKLKLREGLIIWAFIFAVINVLLLIGGGLIDGFGNSPYDHSLKGMLINIFNVGFVLVGREAIRSYVANSMVKKENYLYFFLIALVFTVCNFDIKKYTTFEDVENIVTFGAQYFLPELSQNMLATYLAFLGGIVPSIMYMGILEAFNWLSPALPDLKWITSAVIGILCPLFSLITMQNIYLKEAKLYKRKDTEQDKPLGWILTSLVSIAMIWFAVGVFPIYPSVIATGSMEPVIKPGDVILVDKSIDKSNLNIGDIIQFKRDNILISHRIIEIKEDKNPKEYRTKGDNNSREDIDLVKIEEVKGKIVKVVPKIGWVTLLIKSKRDVPLGEIEF